MNGRVLMAIGFTMVAIGLILVGALLLSGCAVVRSIAYQDMDPAKMAQIKEMGGDIYSCFKFGGPPPLGQTIVIVLPKGYVQNFVFGTNCEIIPMR